MPKATALGNSFLKANTLASQDLKNSEKIYLPQGHEFYITHYAPARNQHVFMMLASPLTTMDKRTRLQKVYGYDPHIKIEGEADKPAGGVAGKLDTTRPIRLKVPYYQQLDNDTRFFGPGWRQCNTTCHAMLADYLLQGKLTQWANQKGYPEPESVYMQLVAHYGDTVEHGPQTKALQRLKIESYWSTTLSSEDIMRSLSYGLPVAAGFAYKGDGHIALIVGHDPIKRWFLVHDPFGIRYGATDSYDVGAWGAYDPYSYGTMQRVYWDWGRQAGWGRIVTSVLGKPTGLPLGL